MIFPIGVISLYKKKVSRSYFQARRVFADVEEVVMIGPPIGAAGLNGLDDCAHSPIAKH
jgi:hypothetical protein